MLSWQGVPRSMVFGTFAKHQLMQNMIESTGFPKRFADAPLQLKIFLGGPVENVWT